MDREALLKELLELYLAYKRDLVAAEQRPKSEVGKYDEITVPYCEEMDKRIGAFLAEVS